MPKRVTVALDKETEKIFQAVNRVRAYGWASEDFREYLKQKYGTTRKILRQLIAVNQKQIDLIYKVNQEYARRINKLK